MNRPSTAVRHIVVLGAQPEWLSGLRGPMIRDFLKRGYRVTAIGAEEMPDVRDMLEAWGAAYVVVPLRRAGLNPLADLRTIAALYRAFKKLKPDLVLAYTVKPIVYGLPIARAAGVPCRYAMITGRGYAFLDGKERSRRLARLLATVFYRLALRFADGVMFHNDDDRQLFAAEGILLPGSRTTRIWGSGVDLDAHKPSPLPTVSEDGGMRFLMVGRLIRDKGVREFAKAAALVRARHPAAHFALAGPLDPSPNGIGAEELAELQASGAIEYRGALTDVRPEIARCHVMVLPSYGEGLPRSVLEGMAAGRAIITTDAPGCAGTVIDGISGLIVPARDAQALARAMERCIRDPGFVASAGCASLALARDRFDVDKVNAVIADFLRLGPRLPVVPCVAAV